MKYKLLITEPEDFHPDAKEWLDSFCNVTAENQTYNDLVKRIKDFEILFIRLGINFDRKLLSNAKKLKYIVSPTTGLDHIDLQAAEYFGVKILSLRGEIDFLKEISATAELAWGLLLSLVRYIPWAYEDVRKGNWDRDLFKGHELSTKRLGIMGLGRLGEKIADYGIAFGMKVIAFDPYRQAWVPGVERADSLHQLLVKSDILSIHIPLNPETDTVIGDEELGILPKGSWVINTSRGKVIDEDALLRHLISGHLSGAALDVLTNELQESNWISKNKLVEYSRKNHNLIITPHIGGATFESMSKTELFMAKKLKNLVNDDRRDSR